MRSRLVLAGATAVALLATGQAGAKTYCNLVREGVAGGGSLGVPSAKRIPPQYDLKTLDLASNDRVLTAVFRVADLDFGPAAPVTAGEYAFAFSVDAEHNYYVDAWVGAGRDRFSVWQQHDPWVAPEDERPPQGGVETTPAPVKIADVPGVVDLARDEIRVTVPLAVFGKGRIVRGTHLDHLGGNSMSYVVPAEDPAAEPFVVGTNEDALSAHAREYYPAGAPSCVKPGR